ncbi:hypothetical protein [Streptomyces sp. NPDC005438]|uniref:hypothetical protein n=1 Tax=Streptomyces sp. NPDC005438 TaxID=3156880 RepID=UPI0033B9D2E1
MSDILSAPSAPAWPHTSEPESLEQLRGDCARIDARYTLNTVHPLSPIPAAHSLPSGVRVPASSAQLLDGMSSYGD